MQNGDKIKVCGTVRDMVGGSVLVATKDGHEYWFKEVHVEEDAAPAPATEPTTPEETPAEDEEKAGTLGHSKRSSHK